MIQEIKHLNLEHEIGTIIIMIIIIITIIIAIIIIKK